MKFTEMQRNMVVEKWGNEYYAKMLNYIDVYSQKWKLSDFEFATQSSHNVIFFCKSKLYGDCVLKLYGLMWEYNALCEYGNTGKFCKVYEFDSETRAMLIERIVPGNTLKDEPSLKKRLTIFSSLFKGLHIEPQNPENYASYQKMVCDVTDVMKTRNNTERLYMHALKMKEIYLEMS